MATTTNYGWTTPDDTALVKDGAAAIRTLGSSVDTTTKNLNPETTLGDISYRSSTANVNTRLPLGTAGQVLKVNSGATAPEWATDASGMTNPMTTTGDTIYSSSGSTPARLGIGSTGQVLTVAAGIPSWATPAAGGGYTLINTGGTAFSGITITISSIPATYKFLYLIVVDAYVATADYIEMRLNGDSGNNYRFTGIQNSNTVLSGYQGDPTNFMKVSTHIGTSTDDNKKTFGVATITNYTATTGVGVFSEFWAYDAGSSLTIASNLTGVHNNSAAVTSLTLRTGNGNSFSGGTAYLYGVN